jgi:hypothetical protein
MFPTLRALPAVRDSLSGPLTCFKCVLSRRDSLGVATVHPVAAGLGPGVGGSVAIGRAHRGRANIRRSVSGCHRSARRGR